MKGYSAFPKAPALLEPHYQIISRHNQGTRSYLYAEKQSVYSVASTDKAISYLRSSVDNFKRF